MNDNNCSDKINIGDENVVRHIRGGNKFNNDPKSIIACQDDDTDIHKTNQNNNDLNTKITNNNNVFVLPSPLKRKLERSSSLTTLSHNSKYGSHTSGNRRNNSVDNFTGFIIDKSNTAIKASSVREDQLEKMTNRSSNNCKTGDYNEHSIMTITSNHMKNMNMVDNHNGNSIDTPDPEEKNNKSNENAKSNDNSSLRRTSSGFAYDFASLDHYQYSNVDNEGFVTNSDFNGDESCRSRQRYVQSLLSRNNVPHPEHGLPSLSPEMVIRLIKIYKQQDNTNSSDKDDDNGDASHEKTMRETREYGEKINSSTTTSYNMNNNANVDNKDRIELCIIDCRYPFEYEGGHLTGGKTVKASKF